MGNNITFQTTKKQIDMQPISDMEVVITHSRWGDSTKEPVGPSG